MTLPVMEPGLDRGRIREWCRRVDAGPFSSLAFGERIAFDNPELLTTMAACAAWTERVRLTMTVVVGTLHDPVLLAKQLATIDVLSGGRLVVGVGIGGREEDYRAVSRDLAHRRMDALADSVASWRGVWSGERVVDGAASPTGPSPARPGGPPILAGALGPRAARHAAAWADGLCGFSWGPSVDEVAAGFEGFRKAWSDAGRDGEPVLSTGFWYALGPGAREQLTGHLRRYLNWLDPAEVESLLPGTGFAGSAEQLRALLDALEGTGCQEAMLVPTSADPDEVDRAAAALG